MTVGWWRGGDDADGDDVTKTHGIFL